MTVRLFFLAILILSLNCKSPNVEKVAIHKTKNNKEVSLKSSQAHSNS